jgi:hypothetical protein
MHPFSMRNQFKQVGSRGGPSHLRMGVVFIPAGHMHGDEKLSASLLCQFKKSAAEGSEQQVGHDVSQQQHEIRMLKMKEREESLRRNDEFTRAIIVAVIFMLGVIFAAIMVAAILGGHISSLGPCLGPSLGGHLEAGLRNLGSGAASDRATQMLVSAGMGVKKAGRAGGVLIAVEALCFFLPSLLSGKLPDGKIMPHIISSVAASLSFFFP